jgi:DeoR family fructose operon transcriptional repressor
MYAEERQLEILTFTRRQGRAEVTALAELLGVTPETVRKDLTVLERRGVVRRVHGGAIPVERLDFEPQLSTRQQRLTAEKERIARAALVELPAEGVVLLDSGSTTETLARLLPTDRELTVVTSSLPIATLLAARRNLTLWCLGGRVRARTLGVVDAWALQLLGEISVDVAFLATNGLSLSKGLTTPEPAEAAVKKAMIATSRRRVLVADHSKFGRDSFCRWASLADIDVLVTDTGLDKESAAEIEDAGPRVVRA